MSRVRVPICLVFFFALAGPPIAVYALSPTGAVPRFLDPEETGLGESLEALLWHEILTALGDQGRAQVMRVSDSDVQQLTELFTQGHHDAAVQMAHHHKVSMVLWGAVLEQDGQIVADTYLTLVP